MSKENYRRYFHPHTCTSASWQKHLVCACQQFLCVRETKVLWSRLLHHCTMTWIRWIITCISLCSVIKVRLTQRFHDIDLYHLKRKKPCKNFVPVKMANGAVIQCAHATAAVSLSCPGRHDYCEYLTENEAEGVLLLTPAQTEPAVGKWGPSLPLWAGSTHKPTYLKTIIVSFQ